MTTECDVIVTDVEESAENVKHISPGNLMIKVNRSTLLCTLLAIVSTFTTTVTCASLTAPIGPGRKCSYCVQGLSGEPDYRAVKLTWKYLHSQEPPAFKVKYCEISQWQGKVRCRQKLYPLSIAIQGSKSKWLHLKKNVHLSNEEESSSNSNEPSPYLGKLIRLEKGSYQAAITDLRMNTNYTINVEADFYVNAFSPDGKMSSTSDDSNLRDFIPYQPTSYETFPIMVETKGFAGKTIRCLGNQSEVVVNTGPYFNGKIFVEGATDESCIVHGNKSSSLQVYTIKINHLLCGSKIVTKDSSVETMIMVHENREILTHNSRRFLVVCQFNPETYTFTASVDVPSHLLKRKKMTTNVNVTSSGTTITSSSGPTGTKPLSNSKEYSFDEKLVSSFHEYATAPVTVTSVSPSFASSSPSTVYSRSYASSVSSVLNNRDSRSNIFKLRLPLHSTRTAATLHSHNEATSLNLQSPSSSLPSITNDEPNNVESSYRSSDPRNISSSRDSRVLSSSIRASNYNRNILIESESSPIGSSASSKHTVSGNNELYGHLILASTIFFTSTLAMAVCYFKCTERNSEKENSHENVTKFNDQVDLQASKLNLYLTQGNNLPIHHNYNCNMNKCQVSHYTLPFSEGR